MGNKISVITVCYNAEKFIEDTILSVISQTYKNLELIIIDGASTDSTLEIINKYKAKISVFITEKDKGIFDAMNKGIINSIGNWIIFLNAGDTFINNSILEEIFQNNVDSKHFIYSPFIACDRGHKKKTIFPKKELNLNNLVNNQIICHQTIIIRKEYLKFYNLNYHLRADYDWIINLVKDLKDNEIFYYPKPTINYLLGGKSSKQLFRDIYETNLIAFRHFGIKAIFLNVFSVCKKIAKYLLNRR
jgi:glycosyltransferase involved in cell wall biosynthesis